MVQKMKLAYIGGGSTAWAWKLMSDLACDETISGEVLLYDIDMEAAKRNEKIGNLSGKGRFVYKAVPTLPEALKGADFVIISILPGGLDCMESDVHYPEKYGIYQSVGDTTGPGGIVRAIRTIPMYVEFAQAIEKYAPNAWVINYTNPMSMCTDTLYRVFPKIKAFGCCHEVFGTQRLLASMLKEVKGLENVQRNEIKVNVKGINHFTWIDSAFYKDIDLLPLYEQFAVKHYEGIDNNDFDEDDSCRMYSFKHRIKFDLFLRYHKIAAAGDRHLAEFCPGQWYLDNPDVVKQWGFGLTTVPARREEYQERYENAMAVINGTREFHPEESGEEGVHQMKALMGMGDLVTNVNLPNQGQVSDLPLGRIVETNAHFTSGKITPVIAGELGGVPHAMTIRVSDNFDQVVTSCLKDDLSGCLSAFQNDQLVTRISHGQAEEMFMAMLKNTEAYLGSYKKIW
ncbi:family 4 glycosyl hydrolase [Youxingia wuxianensis]|uniref:Alpha-glucosidase/alpha-galactosidase n=1 Tax=Youxingia wuxianensis TaxID=2763678 RepID=A0A926IDC1_9FIRM|nr:alpha-glucosidase/alpha-galactosidase [Youxingia wuxianensis]MBC8586137.1 alpha-glucosidase/alpha-galactosidase [Youxingia wuxianensis]